MNLPASALSFLPTFIGLYAGHENLFVPHTGVQLPLIHVYCFSSIKGVTADGDEFDIPVREEIYREIAAQLKLDEVGGAATLNEEQLDIVEVRGVAPYKQMYCVSFRLPAEVAFRRDAEI